MKETTLKEITLSADERLIEAARQRACEEQTTLEEQFRQWLEEYTSTMEPIRDYDAVIAELQGKMCVGKKLSREEMNAR